MTSVEIQAVDPLALRANKLELVERLADDLAHEIKNPLHSMVINLEVLKRRIARATGEDSAELMRYAGILNGELERVSGRIDLLLRLLRPDRAAEPVSMSAAVDELLELVELERERQGVRIDYQPTTRPPFGRLPREMARQLALNLLLTALDLTPAGGTVRIVTEADEAGERLRLHMVPPAGTPAPGVSAARLMVSRALGESLGGEIRLHEPGPEDVGGAALVLTLPGARR